jgi:chromosome segregation ATPase
MSDAEQIMTPEEKISLLREALAHEKENILNLRVEHQGLEDQHRILLDANDGLRDQIDALGLQIVEQESQIDKLKLRLEGALKQR